MILRPLFGITNDWEVYAVMILYTLSIIVRYMPNLWARISHGDLDHYKAVFYQFSRVAERELTTKSKDSQGKLWLYNKFD